MSTTEHSQDMTGTVAHGPKAGWYPDPSGRGSTRYWSGSRWTPWIVADGEVVSEEGGPARRLDSRDIAHLAFIDEVFITRARHQGVIDRDAAGHLASLVARLTEEAHQAPLTVEAGNLILGERKLHIMLPVAIVATAFVWYLVQQVLGIFLRPYPFFMGA